MDQNFSKKISNIPEDKFLTGNNFAKISDVIYSEAIDINESNNLDTNNIETSYTLEENIFIYSLKNFSLKENQIIFCKSDYLLDLFAKLQNVKFSNIKLITGQAATPSVDKKLFKLKPSCISEWYSINVKYLHKSLIPIPLGLGNNFSDVNLHPQDFINNYQDNNLSRINKIFCSFNINTNSVREEYMETAQSNKSLFFVINEKINKYKFFENLKKYNYVLSPPGYGVDTHRFWESMYSGCVPVTKKNYIYDKYFYDHYLAFENIEELNLDSNKVTNLNDNLIEKLTLDFWIKIIKSKNIVSDDTYISVPGNSDYQYNRVKLRKKYIRYKILNSELSFKLKFIDYFKTHYDFDEKLFRKYWY
jgi:hypothetical protein